MTGNWKIVRDTALLGDAKPSLAEFLLNTPTHPEVDLDLERSPDVGHQHVIDALTGLRVVQSNKGFEPVTAEEIRKLMEDFP
jgi:hypothetical protein